MVVDSSIVIDYLRGSGPAKEYLDSLRERGELETHVVVLAEVLSGARDTAEQKEIDRFFNEFQVLQVNEEDSRKSLEAYRANHLSHWVG
jgi:predicted nucleic acid-binding protein